MRTDIRNGKRVAVNTMYLYFRTLLVMCVSVYTSRVILQALGVENFGIYNVVAGFVSMFSLISSSLINSSQRFISFEMGKDSPQVRKVFCGVMSIHLILAILIFILLESLGLWYLNNKLNISPNRLGAAFWVFQCSVVTFCVNLISVPYNAMIIAYERMKAFAYISLVEVLVKLGMVYLLLMMTVDKLIAYAVMMMVVAVLLRFVYGMYCVKKIKECVFVFSIDKPLLKSMLAFSGWNFIGSAAGIFSTQGINILINLFFGVLLNAARGVAEQLNVAINSFVNNFTVAMNPQITKSFAAGDFEYMNLLLIRGAKYAALLYWFFGLTIFVEADFILELWLVEVPEYAPLFLRLAIVYSIFQALSSTLYVGMLATGKIRNYQIIMGSIMIVAFLLCWMMFSMGMSVVWSYLSMILAVFVSMFVRLKLLEGMIPGFSGWMFLRKATFRFFAVVICSSLIQFFLLNYIKINGFVEFALVVLVTGIFVPLFAYFFALDFDEKDVIYKKIRKFSSKIRGVR